MLWIAFAITSCILLLAVGFAIDKMGFMFWRRNTELLVNRLDRYNSPLAITRFNQEELQHLPPPVKTYLQLALTPGQPIILASHCRHSGDFNLGKSGERWKTFQSDQWFKTHPPGFIWNGCISILPGVCARVHDAYIGGEGYLHATIFGLKSVTNMHGRGDLARSELMRYLAECAWNPTALLPSQGVVWTPIDENSALATLSCHGESISLIWGFDRLGHVSTVDAMERPRTVNHRMEYTPWRGRFWNYVKRDGMVIPLDGDVAWIFPDGAQPYWRGHIDKIDYTFAD
ncbi:MAG: DUF6544 family protein [Granulosicoccus sp.]